MKVKVTYHLKESETLREHDFDLPGDKPLSHQDTQWVYFAELGGDIVIVKEEWS